MKQCMIENCVISYNELRALTEGLNIQHSTLYIVNESTSLHDKVVIIMNESDRPCLPCIDILVLEIILVRVLFSSIKIHFLLVQF